jgi:hypothetical protein
MLLLMGGEKDRAAGQDFGGPGWRQNGIEGWRSVQPSQSSRTRLLRTPGPNGARNFDIVARLTWARAGLC